MWNANTDILYEKRSSYSDGTERSEYERQWLLVCRFLHPRYIDFTACLVIPQLLLHYINNTERNGFSIRIIARRSCHELPLLGNIVNDSTPLPAIAAHV